MATDYTGTLGALTTQDSQLLEAAPHIIFQRRASGVNPLWNPDADGFYWGLSATVAAPLYQMNCYEGVSFTEDVSVTDVICDRTGTEASILKRNKLRLTFSLKTLVPLSTVSMVLKTAGIVTGTDYEKGGFGQLTNNPTDYWRIWMPKMYDSASGKWLGIMLHKARVVEAFNLDMTYQNPWMLGVTIDAYADSNLPVDQYFGTYIHHNQDLF